MAVLSIPNTFVTGTTIQAAPFNTNFSAVQTAVNSIDNTNIGAAGLFASNLIPTSAAQATFGGAIGYTHLAPSTGTTPLTVSGVSGQSVDLFDVTLTSGGTKALYVDNNGALNFGAIGAGNIPSTTIAMGGFGSSLGFNVPTGGVFEFFVNGALAANAITKFSASGVQVAPTINSTNTFGYVMPTYLHGGTITTSQLHAVIDQVTAVGATTTITLAGAAVFTSTNYVVVVEDVSASSTIAGVQLISGSQFLFNSTNTHIYNYYAVGY